jgi:hypothetical protein
MFTIKIEGLDKLQKELNDLQRKQLPYATAVALSKTAQSVEKKLKREMAGEFDKPTPYTLKSTFVSPAKKANLEAIVGLKDKGTRVPPAVLLKEHFTGGVRGNKPFEKALAGIGALPSGWRAIPGAGMPLDSYGNPRRNVLREIFGALKTRTKVFKGRGKRVQLVGYFLIPVGSASHLGPGIYLQKNRTIQPMFVFVKSAGYRKVIDLPRIATETVNKEFNREFSTAFANALATAK